MLRVRGMAESSPESVFWRPPSGMVAIPGFYETLRPFARRFEVEDLARRGRLCYVGAGRKAKKEILACMIGKDDLMPAPLNHRGLYRLPWTLPDNAISWLEPTSACNLYCDGCYRKNDPDSHKSLEQVRKELDI